MNVLVSNNNNNNNKTKKIMKKTRHARATWHQNCGKSKTTPTGRRSCKQRQVNPCFHYISIISVNCDSKRTTKIVTRRPRRKSIRKGTGKRSSWSNAVMMKELVPAEKKKTSKMTNKTS
uniref:50S ribosomal protein L21 n=2 Tax=Lygus hesperus TaxID=30085 RepID=A0A0A9Z8F9_LYGHE